MAFRLARPSHLIDINGIEALKEIRMDGDRLCIGAGARHADFHKPVCDGPLGQLLSTVVKDIAHYPIRMRGTFCGSCAHADPASEWCLVAATLDATMVALSEKGERLIPAADFFETVMTTALAEDEMLREVRIPALGADTKFGFEEFNRRAGDFGIAMALVTYRVDGGVMADPRVGVGGAEDRPRRIADAEAALAGKAPGDEAFHAAAEAASAAVDPMEDHTTSAGYRRDLVATMVRRALEKASQ
jgi:carbon-monoxide dehydrogenase medium subunit